MGGRALLLRPLPGVLWPRHHDPVQVRNYNYTLAHVHDAYSGVCTVHDAYSGVCTVHDAYSGVCTVHDAYVLYTMHTVVYVLYMRCIMHASLMLCMTVYIMQVYLPPSSIMNFLHVCRPAIMDSRMDSSDILNLFTDLADLKAIDCVSTITIAQRTIRELLAALTQRE